MNQFIYDMPERDYFAHDAMSNSKLKHVEKSPAHYMAYIQKDDEEPSKAQRLGKLIHTMCLENELMESKYHLLDVKLDMRKKADKELKAEIEQSGKEIISLEDYELATAIYESIRAKKASNKLLYGYEHKTEASAFWTDTETQVECKGRFDLVTDCGILVDLKTAMDASKKGFKKAVRDYGYHRQAAMYMDAYKAISGQPARGFYFVAVEKTAPFAVAVYQLAKEEIEQGRRDYKRLLNIYAKCEQESNFYGYPEKVQTLELDNWALDDDLKRMA